LLGALGFGAVIYASILAMRTSGSRGVPAAARSADPPRVAAAAPAPTEAGTSGPTIDATAAGATTAGATGAAADSGGNAPTSAPAAPPSPGLELTLPLAGFWIRMAALLIDTILILVIVHVLSGYRENGNVLLLLAIYGAVLWKLRGTTVGGAVCHLKVVRLDGRPIDWGTAVVRALGCLLSLAVAGLGFFWIAIDPQRQAWHDKIAGTVVVQVPEGVPLL
jgi:uncharacterized RDD family membrane protein YckC